MATNRGMWVYPTQNISTSVITPSVADITSWCSSKAVKRVYLGVTTPSMSDPLWLAYYRSLKTSLAALGAALYAGAGTASWGTPAGAAAFYARDWTTAALTLKESNGTTQLFSPGVMLDVEPHTLTGADAWVTPYPGGITNGPSQAQMVAFARMAQDCKAAAVAKGTQVHLCLPAWLQMKPAAASGTVVFSGTKSIGRELANRSHSITYMTFWNTQPYIMYVANLALPDSAAEGRPARIAVEVDYDNPANTYYGYSRAYMEGDMNAVVASAATSYPSTVTGIDVHHYRTTPGYAYPAASWHGMAP